MQQSPFDDLARMVATKGSRRAVGRLVGLAAAPVIGLGAAWDTEAKKKKNNKKKKKVTLCVAGVTTKVPKKKKKQFIRNGATAGPCAGGCTPVCNGCGGSNGCGGTCGCTTPAVCFQNQCCTRTCTTGACGGNDGCGGTCTCPAGQVCNGGSCCTPTCTGCGGSDGCGNICGCPAGQTCDAGTCQAFDLVCNDTPDVCGAALEAALADGGTIYLGPGTYEGNFAIGTSTTLIGVGSGSNPATNTILDGGGSGTVVPLAGAQTTTLRNLRITNGDRVGDQGGGIRADNQVNLTVENSVITENASTGGSAGGIAVISSSLVMRNSTVSGNSAVSSGGVSCNSGLSCEFTDSVITENTATGSVAGGVSGFNTDLIFNNTEVSLNQAATNGGGVFIGSDSASATFDPDSSVINNTADTSGSGFTGGGIYNQGGDLALNGAELSGNAPDQCSGTDPVVDCPS